MHFPWLPNTLQAKTFKTWNSASSFFGPEMSSQGLTNGPKNLVWEIIIMIMCYAPINLKPAGGEAGHEVGI